MSQPLNVPSAYDLSKKAEFYKKARLKLEKEQKEKHEFDTYQSCIRLIASAAFQGQHHVRCSFLAEQYQAALKQQGFKICSEEVQIRYIPREMIHYSVVSWK